MRTISLFIVMAFLVSCKTQEEKDRELALSTVRQYVEDFNFKRNQNINIERLDLISITEKSVLYMDTVNYINLVDKISYETNRYSEIVSDFEDKVNEYGRIKTLIGRDTELTNIYKRDAEKVQKEMEAQKELLSNLMIEDSLLETKLKSYKGDSTIKVATFYFKGVVSDKNGNSENILDTVDYFLTNDFKRVLNK